MTYVKFYDRPRALHTFSPDVPSARSVQGNLRSQIIKKRDSFHHDSCLYKGYKDLFHSRGEFIFFLFFRFKCVNQIPVKKKKRDLKT